MSKLDPVDRELLRLLQQDAETPMARLGEAVKLSPTPCWRRIQRLKRDKVIARQVMLVDPARLGLRVTAFVTLRIHRHHERWLDAFQAMVRRMPEVVEFYRMNGGVDYLLRLVLPDLGAYDAIYRRLIRHANLAEVSTSFAIEELKFTTALPTDHAA